MGKIERPVTRGKGLWDENEKQDFVELREEKK